VVRQNPSPTPQLVPIILSLPPLQQLFGFSLTRERAPVLVTMPFFLWEVFFFRSPDQTSESLRGELATFRLSLSAKILGGNFVFYTSPWGGGGPIRNFLFQRAVPPSPCRPSRAPARPKFSFSPRQAPFRGTPPPCARARLRGGDFIRDQ